MFSPDLCLWSSLVLEGPAADILDDDFKVSRRLFSVSFDVVIPEKSISSFSTFDSIWILLNSGKAIPLVEPLSSESLEAAADCDSYCLYMGFFFTSGQITLFSLASQRSQTILRLIYNYIAE